MKKFRNKIIVFGRPAIVLSTVRCLQGTGIKADVVVVGGLNELVKWSRFVDRYYDVSTEEEGLYLIEYNYSQEREKSVLISCNDSIAELIDSRREQLRKHFIISDCESSGEFLSHWMRKDVMCRLAEEVGFSVPRTWTLDLSQKSFTWDSFVFPCITKALKSSKGQKNATWICKNRKDLQVAVQNAKQYTDFLLVQEFIPFDQGYCTLGVRLNNSKETIIGRTGKRLRSNLRVYGYPTFSHLEQALPPRVDEGMIKSYVERTGYTGVFSFETVVTSNKTYFIEINFRTDGKIFGMPAAGCNIVVDWLYDAIGKNILSKKISKDIYVMFGTEDFQHVKSNEITLWSWLKDVLRTSSFHTLSLKDPLPFMVRCLRKVITINKSCVK